MILYEGRQRLCLGYLQPWGWRWNRKLWELNESRTTDGGATADGDEKRYCEGVKCLMGERAGWRDPGVYVGIEWGYCTRTRAVGPR